jgi:hypothetical protein
MFCRWLSQRLTTGVASLGAIHPAALELRQDGNLFSTRTRRVNFQTPAGAVENARRCKPRVVHTIAGGISSGVNAWCAAMVAAK